MILWTEQEIRALHRKCQLRHIVEDVVAFLGIIILLALVAISGYVIMTEHEPQEQHETR